MKGVLGREEMCTPNSKVVMEVLWRFLDIELTESEECAAIFPMPWTAGAPCEDGKGNGQGLRLIPLQRHFRKHIANEIQLVRDLN